MTRQIHGFFHTHGRYHHPLALLAPFVNVIVGDASETQPTQFMIDTGADFTTLAPRDALELYGRQYLDLDFAQLSGSFEPIGVGRGDVRMILSPMQLRFRTEDGEVFTVVLRVAIVEPVPQTPGEHGNWLTPSLLGRDLLEHFDLHLSYHPPAAVLEEASASS